MPLLKQYKVVASLSTSGKKLEMTKMVTFISPVWVLDKGLLLKALTSKLPAILPKETSETIAKLWQIDFLSKTSPKKGLGEMFVYLT